MRFLLTSILVIHVVAVADPFRNLGFDEVNTERATEVSPGDDFGLEGPIEDILPGWSFEAFGRVSNTFGVRRSTIDLEIVPSVYDTSGFADGTTGFPVDGDYGLFLKYTTDFGAQIVAQTGDIPGNARSMSFLTYGADLNVYIDGQPLEIRYQSISGSGIHLYRLAAVDVTPFAGMTSELRFETTNRGHHDPWFAHGWGVTIDRIQFSPEIIPEPSSVALLFLGMGTLALVLRKEIIGSNRD